MNLPMPCTTSTADIEAYTTQRWVTLDQYHLLAKIGRTERSGVAARARAQHHEDPAGRERAEGADRRRDRVRHHRRDLRPTRAVEVRESGGEGGKVGPKGRDIEAHACQFRAP